MSEPLTADEVVDVILRLRVDRPLHWTLARRLLAEVLRLRPELLVPTPRAPRSADEAAGDGVSDEAQGAVASEHTAGA